MDLGLGNLSTLKTWLLAPALVSGTDYDAQLITLGKGVAESMEEFCNRRFGRVVGEIFECTADRTHIVVPRYPVESIALVEQRDTIQDGWYTLPTSDYIWNEGDKSGLIYFNARLGSYLSRLRVTFTGGFWYETKEPSDAGYPTAQPSGSTSLPPSLLHAWLIQCEHIWTQHDKLGRTIADAPSTSAPLLEMRLVPEAERILRSFIRYALS